MTHRRRTDKYSALHLPSAMGKESLLGAITGGNGRKSIYTKQELKKKKKNVEQEASRREAGKNRSGYFGRRELGGQKSGSFDDEEGLVCCEVRPISN